MVSTLTSVKRRYDPEMLSQLDQDQFDNLMKGQQRYKALTAPGVTSANSGTSGSGSGSSSTSSSASSNALGGIGNYSDLVKQAKDLAQFRLGLDKQQAETSYDFRKREADEGAVREETRAQSDFGRQTKLKDQDYGWQNVLNTATQEAQTNRLEKELENRIQQQQAGINQENLSTNRAIRLASRRLGAR